ncbi:MAG TPA: DUF3761 domain-containing protein [Terracidiphilus sp.]|jgi:hypothetical protein
MNRQIVRFGLGALLAAATACYAQAPAGAPDGATGQCKDGSYTKAHTKSGSCKGHQGVQTWYATVGGATDPDIKGPSRDQKAARQTSKSDSVVNPTDNSAVSAQRADAINKKSPNAVVATPTNNGNTIKGPGANGSADANASANGSTSGNTAKRSASGSMAGSTAGRQAAPGGGPGLVWLNTSSNTYHCYGTTHYGTTKNGKYVSEKDAMNAGAKPDHGKSCSAR